MAIQYGAMWKKMKTSATGQFIEAAMKRGDPDDAEEIAGLVANQVARDFLTSHETYVQFLQDDPQLLWRSMGDKEDCETIEDVLFEFAEGDLTQFLLNSILPFIAFSDDEEESD